MKQARKRVGPAYARFLFVLVGLAGCRDQWTPTDRARVRELVGRFDATFEIRPLAEIYIMARNRRQGCPAQEEGEAMVKQFWTDGRNGKRADTAFAYLNLLDDQGRFCFQLYWDPKSNGPIRSTQAFY